MSIVVISLIAAVCFGSFFLFVSLFSKREDYMLDDYTDEDKPDNVRIIKKDITKIIEKEVEVVNTQEIDRLNEKLKEVISKGIEFKEKVFSKESELNLTLTKITDIESDFNTYKNKMNDELKNALKEKDELFNSSFSILNENRLIKKSMGDQENENNNLIEKLKKEKYELEAKNNELINERESTNKIIEDRDYFIKLVEKKDKEIKSIKHDLNYEYQKHPNVYEGVDEYGSFYDISLIPSGKFSKDHVTKILEASREIDADQFAYYGVNTSNGHESLEVYNINKLSSFIERVQRKKTDGKYKIYIILDNRVYYYEIY
jgi:hypothetical protein